MKLCIGSKCTVRILLGTALCQLCEINLFLLINSSKLVRPNWDDVQYALPWLHEAKQMLGKLLLVNQKELELVMINMTNEWLKTMNHVGKHWCYIFALPLALSTTTNGQYNNNLSRWSPRMKTAHTMISMPPLENSSQRAAEGQIKVDVIQAEPEATAKRTSSQDNVLFKPDWTYSD